MPSRSDEQQHGMRPPPHRAADLVEVELHGFRVGVRHGQPRTDAAGQAHRAEQGGVLIALVGGLAGP